MTEPVQPAKRGAHWESFWSDTNDDAQAMGGEAKRDTLKEIWTDFFLSAGLTSSDCVLDIGSGAAPIARIAEQACASPDRFPQFIGLDYSLSALTSARALCSRPLLAVAGDASAPPFADNQFACVVSQFGVEYAGHAGLRAAAAMTAPTGGVAAVMHFRGGAIENECSDNARLLDGIADTGLISSAQTALTRTYTMAAENAGRLIDNDAEQALKKAAHAARAMIDGAPHSSSRILLDRFFTDLNQLCHRRMAYAPADSLAWLEGFSVRLADYAARMKAMVGAAMSADDIGQLQEMMAGAGLAAFNADPVVFMPGALPGAWWVTARAPAIK